MDEDAGDFRIQRIVIPYAPRPQFQQFHDRKARWAIGVAHRRAGKTVAIINDLLSDAITCKQPNPRVAYVAPTYTQAKDVAWSYVKQFTSAIPGVEFNESELRANLPNGATFRLYGSDNYDRMRGLYFDAVALDEVADMDPRAWSEVIRPALADRKGRATFIGTPKGRNAFSQTWDRAATEPDWFRFMLKASETGLLDAAELEGARREMTPEQYEQEFECSFQAAVLGSYYGREMESAEREGRIGDVPYEPAHQVHTAWDLGIGDATAIIMFQIVGSQYRIIDYIEHSGVALGWYVNELRSRPYTWGNHFLPHDAQAKELGTGVSRLETLRTLGLGSADIIGQHNVDDGITGVRLMLPKCWFRLPQTKRLVDCLREYRAAWDEKRQVLQPRPLHNWASHGADAMRYAAMARPRNQSTFSRKINYTNWAAA